MAFTDLHEIEEMFQGLVVFDVSNTGWTAKLSVEEMRTARMAHQQSPKGAELHRRAQAAYKARNIEVVRARARTRQAALKAARPPKAAKIAKVCAVEGCQHKHAAKGLCETHYQKQRREADASYAEKHRTYHRERYRQQMADPAQAEEIRRCRRESKARCRAKVKRACLPSGT